MKRILAIILTLVTLLAALTGCMASKNPSGKEGEQNPSGNRLPITLTIAETLPSCVAFEHKDGKPYCFYAYDTEGHLYRVLWNDFTGLNEKDVVVVDHNDDIKKVDEVNPPGGWSPQYEVTATGIKTEKRANDYLVSHIQIKSGKNTIQPFGCMIWSKIDNDDGTFTESIVDKYDVIDLLSGKTPFAITDIPKLVLNDKVSYFVQVNGRVEKVYLLTPNDDTYTKSETTFDALSNLADGTYYVVLEVLLSGNCDPDAPQNSYRYEDVFCLVVGDDDNSHDDGIPPYDAMLNLEVWDGKFLFQRIATTPCIVYSNTPINDMSKGTVFEDRHDILTTIFQAMHGKDAIMNTPECEFSRYIYMFDSERENIPWHYRFAICNCGAVMITNNDELICTIKLTEEERRSIIPADLLVDLEPSDTNNATEFSYADELAMFPEGTPGVKKTGFRNTTELPVHNDVEAIGRAMNECTIEWSATEVYYDATKEIWKVTFYTKGVPGGDQSVYLGANGITLMIVYGE